MLIDRKYLLARQWSNRELRRIAPFFHGAVVNVSGWDDRDKEGGRYRSYFTGCSSYSRTNYGGFRGYQGDADEIALDLTEDLTDDLKGRFDVVFNHTTLEHIFDARKAFANLCAMSRDAVIVVVPFSQLQHESESYGDYWRFTPTCIRKMFEENGMTTIYEAENHEKNAAIYVLCVGSRFPDRYFGLLPRHRPICNAGRGIGASILNDAVSAGRSIASIILKGKKKG